MNKTFLLFQISASKNPAIDDRLETKAKYGRKKSNPKKRTTNLQTYGKKSWMTSPTAPYFLGWLWASQMHRFMHSWASRRGMLGRSSTDRSTQPISDSETPTRRFVMRRESEPLPTFSELMVRPMATVRLLNPRNTRPTAEGISEKVRRLPERWFSPLRNVGSMKDSITKRFKTTKPPFLLFLPTEATLSSLSAE